MSTDRTNPFDVVLALRLLSAAGTLASIAEEMAVAPSQVHAALKRLERAGLLRADKGVRAANARAFGEFILFGVQYAFPAERGPLADGIATAYSAPALAEHIDAVDVLVWPTRADRLTVRGFSIKPLYGGAVRLVETSPETYRLLTLVDAMRLGEPRARNGARVQLEQALGWRG